MSEKSKAKPPKGDVGGGAADESDDALDALANDEGSDTADDGERMLGQAYDALKDGDRKGFIASMRACGYAKE